MYSIALQLSLAYTSLVFIPSTRLYCHPNSASALILCQAQRAEEERFEKEFDKH